MTAIAAVLALSSTQLLAQTAPEATPPVTEAPATAVPESAPAAPAATTVPESAPAPTTAIEPSATIASDPIATSAEPTTTKSSKSTTTRRTASAARPAKAAAPVARASAAAPVAAPIAAPAQTAEAAPTPPIVAIPADPPPAVVATPSAQDAFFASNDLLPIAGAAGLGVLVLAGGALAIRRRRRLRAEEAEDAEWQAEEAAVAGAEPAMTVEPAPEPALTDEPAFEAPAPAEPIAAEPAFEAPAPRPAEPAPAFILGAASAASASGGDCIEAAPGSHVEAACDGPTENNPSLSIKKRLKRAHFFDQREFLAEAGEVAPMAADAGLPGAAAAPEPAESTREPA